MQEDEGSGRIEIYEEVFFMVDKFDQKELLIGHGHNSTSEMIGTFAHNEFLQVLIDYGLIGLFLYIALHLILIRKSITLIREKSSFAASFFASYILFITIAMVSHWFVMAQFVVILVSYWGAVFGISAKNRSVSKTFRKSKSKLYIRQSENCNV